MDETKQTTQVFRAVNARLSGLQGDPRLAQRVLANAKGNRKVKKKLSLGFVLLMVLLLAAVTALAAMALNTYYEKAIQKEGENGLIQNWSADDQAALVDWMIEAGIELDGEKVAKLQDAGLTREEKSALAMGIITGYYPARDGILTTVDIIAKEKGPVEYWSLEYKAWFSELMLSYQPDEIGGVNKLPGKDDITQEEALDIAYAYFKNEYGLEQDDFDKSKTAMSFGEATWDDGSGPERITSWGITLWLYSDTRYPLGITILPDGTIKQAHGPYVPNWRDEWYDTYIGDNLDANFWTIEGTYEFQQSDWANRVADLQAQGETIGTNLLHLVTKHFGKPSATDIPPDEALAIANRTVSESLNLSDEQMHYYLIRRAYLLDDYEFPVYYFWYLHSAETRDLSQNELDKLVKMVVLVNATDGSVVEAFPTQGLTFEDIV